MFRVTAWILLTVCVSEKIKLNQTGAPQICIHYHVVPDSHYHGDNDFQMSKLSNCCPKPENCFLINTTPITSEVTQPMFISATIEAVGQPNPITIDTPGRCQARCRVSNMKRATFKRS